MSLWNIKLFHWCLNECKRNLLTFYGEWTHSCLQVNRKVILINIGLMNGNMSSSNLIFAGLLSQAVQSLLLWAALLTSVGWQRSVFLQLLYKFKAYKTIGEETAGDLRTAHLHTHCSLVLSFLKASQTAPNLSKCNWSWVSTEISWELSSRALFEDEELNKSPWLAKFKPAAT